METVAAEPKEEIDVDGNAPVGVSGGGVGVEVVVGGAGCDAPHRRVVQDGEVINKNYFIGAEIKYFLSRFPKTHYELELRAILTLRARRKKRLRRASEEAF